MTIKNAFESFVAILIYLFGGIWLLWMLKYTYENSNTLEDILPRMVEFTSFTILTILGSLLAIGLVVGYIAHLRRPTLLEEVTEKEPEEPSEEKKEPATTESRGASEEFSFGKLKPGSNEASIAYKNSEEHRKTQEAIRELDVILSDARSRVGAQ